MAKPAPKAAPASAKKVPAAKPAASAAKSTTARPAKTRAKAAPARGKAPAPAKAAATKPRAAGTSTPKVVAGKATATKAGGKPTKAAASAKAADTKSAARSAKAVTRATAPAKSATKTVSKAAAKAPAKKAKETPKVPTPKLVTPFDDKFLDAQRRLLLEERAKLLGQAEVLEGEAASLMADLEPGDVQFDDESGDGDSIVVERERDLALSAQARQLVTDIDAALARIDERTYGLSLVSGRPIPKERLKAIPWATELVEEKVGGLGRR